MKYTILKIRTCRPRASLTFSAFLLSLNLSEFSTFFPIKFISKMKYKRQCIDAKLSNVREMQICVRALDMHCSPCIYFVLYYVNGYLCLYLVCCGDTPTFVVCKWIIDLNISSCLRMKDDCSINLRCLYWKNDINIIQLWHNNTIQFHI